MFEIIADLLSEFAAILNKRGAQDFMPPQEFVQSTFQRRYVERTSQLQRDRDVVVGALWFELIQEPQSFLRERQRQWAIALNGDQRRQCCKGILRLVVNHLRERRHCACLEQRT